MTNILTFRISKAFAAIAVCQKKNTKFCHETLVPGFTDSA